MRLKSVVLDGFKSYAHRQEIGDLDPHFNAITGLNGSGKSNIFDALCFVMGISNLKRVRAEDTRDLIFKSGNAGIQKASVTIEFINDDPFNHPPGYSPTEYPLIRISRQVQVGGKQKFFLNDRVSDQAKVKAFFHNALLNVDNAHFMVLQGTVHKMIGMKSSEILGLLEEASGTRVFDTRRRTAENLLRSKEKRVESITETINEITPRVLAMKQQQEEYSKFVQAREGLAERTKFSIAHFYWSHLKSAEEKRAKAANQHENIELRKQQLIEIPRQRETAQKRLNELAEAIEPPQQSIERLHNMESELKKEAAKSKAQSDACDKAIKALERDIKRIQLEKEQTTKKLDKYKQDTGKVRDNYEVLQQQKKDTREAIEGIKESIRLNKAGVQAGLSGHSAQEEHADASRRIIALDGEIGRACEHLERLKLEQQKLTKEAERDQQGLKSIQQTLAKATESFKKAEMDYEPHKHAVGQVHVLRQQVSAAKQDYQEQLNRVLSSSTIAQPLQYDPIPGLNADAAIHGRVGELVTPIDIKYSKALTVGAGAINIQKIVIDNDSIAQQLIERGRLRTRVNFLPLNRITANSHINESQMAAAREIASSMGGFVEPATALVQYSNPSYKTVAQLTFGNFVVVSSLQLATRLANDSSTRMKAVTLDGDMADPMGLVAGGSSKQIRDWVAEFAGIVASKAPLKKLEDAIQSLSAQLQSAEQAAYKARPLLDALNRAEQHLSEVQNQFNAMAGNSATGRLEKVSAAIESISVNIATFKKEREETSIKIDKLNAIMAEAPKKNEEALQVSLKEAQQKLDALEKEIAKGSDQFENMGQQMLELETKGMSISEELAGKEQEVAERRAEKEVIAKEGQAIADKQAHTANTLRIEEEKAQSILKEQEEVKEELKKLQVQEDLCQKEVKDGEATAKILRREAEADQHKVDHTAKDHQWVLREAATFGDVNGIYFFDDEERTRKALAEVEALKQLLQQSERTVNEKASMMYEEYQKDLDTLVQQRGTLMTDREIILDSISAVEKRKWGALDKMFNTVSTYFGKLFSMCLPGASARLVEERCPETQRLTGLQVKVTFNGKEKESLTELSGGQRSLLALCLILAILRVRPAPVYILDEVDAALDPSHTQNIGQMLQTHFPTSQFLLVSLKDGMFNNANVLYEIRNTQGYSEVTRRAAGKKK